jgi:[acyl-carrier-protein] S-malonyltransferase
MLKKEILTTSGSQVEIAFGLSLGELTALALADVYDFTTGLRLASARGSLMQEASRQNPGGMLALLGASLDEVHELCSRTGVEMANFNTPSQVVVAGTIAQIQEAETLAQSLSFSRVVPLKVAGASHCSLMKEARDAFHDYLKNATFRKPQIPVIQNVDAEVATAPETIKKNLEAQLVSPVLWYQSMQKAVALGFEEFYECGVGRTLKGMAKQMDPRLQVFSVQDTEFVAATS